MSKRSKYAAEKKYEILKVCEAELSSIKGIALTLLTIIQTLISFCTELPVIDKMVIKTLIIKKEANNRNI